MNKKVPIAVVLALLLLTSTISYSIATVVSVHSLNQKIAGVGGTDATVQNVQKKIAEIDAIVRKHYIGEIDEKKVVDAAAEGYMDGVGDQYGYYLNADQAKKREEGYKGNTTGIGITATKDPSGYLYVVKVISGSPAAGFQLKKGDLIVSIGSQAVNTITFNQAVELLSGEEGTKVTFTYRRDGADKTITVTRRAFKEPSVELTMMENIAYLQINSFNHNTADEFSAQLKEAKKQGAKSLIFDLRNNGGGTLDSTKKMVDMLVPEGPILYTMEKDGEKKLVYSSDANEETLPMTILTNGDTASAAELFTASLRDYNKAKIVGTKTYGKGVMQDTFELSDNSVIVLTIAKYYPKSGTSYDGEGIKPDYEVKLTEEQSRTFYMLTPQQDPQLQKALEVARAAIPK